ncbi:MAG: hypothetical protein GY796_15260 [Chloroflexi bacterium]|nr:hypothetical protein [Chloroflexota bacterium]
MADGLQLQAQLLLAQGQPEAARLALDEALALAEGVEEAELLAKVWEVGGGNGYFFANDRPQLYTAHIIQ